MKNLLTFFFVIGALTLAERLIAQPTISLTDDIWQPVWFHEAQTLYTGEVLLCGGDDGNAATLEPRPYCYRFDPTSETWSYVTPMADERTNFATVILNDGSVLAIGGSSLNAANAHEDIDRCEIYDVANDSWSPAAPMNQVRYLHRAVRLDNGNVLVAAGLPVSSTSEVYDPYLDQWSYSGNLNVERGERVSLLKLGDGRVLATGGNSLQASRTAEIYDPQTGQWTMVVDSMNYVRSYHESILLSDGRVLIVGGSTGSANNAEIFDPVTELFTSVSNCLTDHGSNELVLLDDGRVMVYGIGDLTTPGNTKVIEIFDPATNQWSTGNYSIYGRQVNQLNRLSSNKFLASCGSIYAGSGATNSSYLITFPPIGGCAVPNLSLSVTGQNSCVGDTTNNTIMVANSEMGVNYQLMIAGDVLDSVYTGGGNLVMSVPISSLAIGENVFQVVAQAPGCEAYLLTDTAQINYDYTIPTLNVSASGPTSFCVGDSVLLTTSSGFAGYQWTTGTGGAQMYASASGSYQVQAIDGSGCLSAPSNAIDVDVSQHAKLEFDSVSALVCGPVPLNVRLLNQCTDTLFSTEISWSRNGVIEGTYLWQGILAPGDSTPFFGLGVSQIESGANLFEGWADNENGLGTSGVTLDTTVLDVPVQAMSGTYTIGGTNPDFVSLLDANTAVGLNGLCGPVIFNIRPGTYVEDVLVIYDVLTVTPVNTVTWQAENGDPNSVVITESHILDFVVRIGGAHNYFKNLTFDKPGRILEFVTHAQDIAFNNCIFNGEPSASTSTAHSIAYFNHNTGIDIKDISFLNCRFNRGSHAIFIGNYPQTSFASSILIQGCEFDHQSTSSIYYRKVNGSTIDGNTFLDTVYSNGGTIFAENGSGYPLIITNNKFSNHHGGGVSIASHYADSVNRSLIGNNMFAIGTRFVGGGGSAISFNKVQRTDVMHNTVHQRQDQGRAFSDGTSSLTVKIRMINNNFVCVGGYSTVYSFGRNVSLMYSVFTECENNNLYSTSGTIAEVSSGALDINGWRALEGHDTSSISVLPDFADYHDLHLLYTVTNMALNGAGVQLTEIPLDIDMEVRDMVTPDLGADEMNIYSLDMMAQSLVGQSSSCDTVQVYFSAQNLSLDTVQYFEVGWELDNVVQPAYIWTGSLSPFDTASTILLGEFPVVNGSSYNVTAWVTSPNMGADAFGFNDTITYDLDLAQGADLGPDTLVCHGAVVVLDPGQFDHYLWSDSSTSATLSINQVGSYAVTVTDDIGCVSHDTIEVLPLTPTLAQIVGPVGGLACVGDTVVLSTADGSLGLWSDGSTDSTFVLVQTDTVTLIQTDSLCTSTDTVIITYYPNPIVDLGNDTSICSSCTINLDAGNTGSAFLWSEGSITQTLTATPGQLYWVQVTNSSGCYSIDSIWVGLLSSVASINEGISSVRVYPNPSTGYVTIDMGTLLTERITVDCYSSTGQLLYHGDFKASDSSKFTIDISETPPQPLMLVVTLGTKRLTRTLILH